MSNTRRSYDLVAERYASEIGDELIGKPFDRALLAAFAELAPAGPLLDAGCGPGHVGHYLAGGGRSVFGLDLAPAMCLQTSRRTGLPAAAADMSELPIRSGSVAGLISMYAVIHLDDRQRAAAYREFARVLVPAGPALIAFHTSDAGAPVGSQRTLTEWWDQPVELTFRFLDPDGEVALLADAGLQQVARLDRQPLGSEHPSQRCYLLVRKPDQA
ncbi:MAG: class I SAM-dependent methyltransferase [Jatrophihabitantaceae bacterium]